MSNDRLASRAPMRLLLFGAVGGLVSTIVGLLVVPTVEDGVRGALVRMAIVAPAVLYVVWWVLWPGLQKEDTGAEGDEQPMNRDHTALLEQIFDSAGQSARGDAHEQYRVQRQPITDSTEDYRHTVRRPATGVPAVLRPRFRADQAS